MPKKTDVLSFQLIVIGAGGTGTYFLKEVSRYLSNYGHNCPIKEFSIYDGDTVEEKNLDRQCFIKEDIGANKACIMGEVLNDAFDLNWKTYPIYVSDVSQIKINPKYVPIVVGCVDNHACRMIIEKLFNTQDNIIYLDSANEYSSGEVIFAAKIHGKEVAPVRSHYFPEIKLPEKSRQEMTCTELNQAAPQHIKTNMAAGNILLVEVTSICESTFHGGMVCFDTERFYQEFIPYLMKEGDLHG